MILTKRIYIDAIAGKASAVQLLTKNSDSYVSQIAQEIIDLVELIRRKDQEEWEKQTDKIQKNEIWL